MSGIDFEKHRLRRFVERLAEMDEVQVCDEPVPLVALSAIIEASEKATLFRNAGPQGQEIVAGVMGSRRRLAAAFGVDETEMVEEYNRRMARPRAVIEVPRDEAPVQQVVLTGDDVDLAALPFHVQHEQDGGPYISAGIDYSVDPATGKRNVGCRRLMLRDRRTMRSNLSQPSDLKRIYLGCVERGERLPVSFVIGSHPVDFVAATLRLPVDEFALIGTLRGEDVPMVRCVTNDVLVPADAELVVEGYFDERGHCEPEGPYGEFWGYYGPVHADPVFHATAITMRGDALHQTLLHGGRRIGRMEMTAMAGLQYESAIRRVLQNVSVQPAAVNVVAAAAPRHHVRLALRRGVPGQARVAISALFSMTGVKHVVVVDEDVDPFSDAEVEWAISTRFRPDVDLMVLSDMPGYYTDPTAAEGGMIAKIGFDATAPYGRADTIEHRRPSPPAAGAGTPRCASVEEALREGPLYFLQIMQALGSDDGREIAVELERLQQGGAVSRLADGEWTLAAPGATGPAP